MSVIKCSLLKRDKKQGLKIKGETQQNQILDKIAEVASLHPDTIRRYLSDDFKQPVAEGGFAPEIVDVTGLSERTVREYLQDKKKEGGLSESGSGCFTFLCVRSSG